MYRACAAGARNHSARCSGLTSKSPHRYCQPPSQPRRLRIVSPLPPSDHHQPYPGISVRHRTRGAKRPSGNYHVSLPCHQFGAASQAAGSRLVSTLVLAQRQSAEMSLGAGRHECLRPFGVECPKVTRERRQVLWHLPPTTHQRLGKHQLSFTETAALSRARWMEFSWQGSCTLLVIGRS